MILLTRQRAPGASKEDVDSKHGEIVAKPLDLAIVAEQGEVDDAQDLDQEGQRGEEDHIEGAVVDQVFLLAGCIL